MSLLRWGWNAYFEAIWKSAERGNAVTGRVISQQRKFWTLAGEFGESLAEASGKLRLAAGEGADWPAVGDWVAAEVHERGGAMIHEVLPRRSKFARKTAGKRVQEQVLAANVDTAFLVSALDGDFNPRRVERYLAQCWESGARPVIVLNKADACERREEKAREMESIAMGVPVCVISARTGYGFAELKTYLMPGQTFALLGSSGVGKSTIVNRLMGRAIQEVQEVRESDSRGRHTTTARELFVLSGGALLIDTPGLRELQLWDASEGIARTFGEIAKLGAACKFTNCRHEGEPGCAVARAVEEGTLESERLKSHRKLLKEQEFLRRKLDPEAALAWKNRVKTLHKEVRKIYKSGKHK